MAGALRPHALRRAARSGPRPLLFLMALSSPPSHPYCPLPTPLQVYLVMTPYHVADELSLDTYITLLRLHVMWYQRMGARQHVLYVNEHLGPFLGHPAIQVRGDMLPGLRPVASWQTVLKGQRGATQEAKHTQPVAALSGGVACFQELVASGQLLLVLWTDTGHHEHAPRNKTWVDSYLMQASSARQEEAVSCQAALAVSRSSGRDQRRSSVTRGGGALMVVHVCSILLADHHLQPRGAGALGHRLAGHDV